ncbi:MAG TPA: FAD-binding domain-containing protein, partial [Puia sp.]|nr:FAD-binding domain-containing protein [Puia sp.]
QESTLRNYDRTRNIPGIAGTSLAGPHLRFGAVSIRHLVRLGLDYSDTWLNELIWREFFMMILFHFPYVVHGAFKKQYELIRWRNDPGEFDRWRRGDTGYPIVDAGMRQLNATGWMPNRVRMIAASFLVKDLLVDWRWGEAWFAEKLIDYELASNNGNWQWVAGTGCDAAPWFRIFNPHAQTLKFDPSNAYIDTWVREPPSEYPSPIVDHATAKARALLAYKEAFAFNS